MSKRSLGENPSLNTAHKVVSTFVTPIILGLLSWVAVQFWEMRDALRDLRKTVEIEMPHLKEADSRLDGRVTRLEGHLFGRRDR